MLFDHFQSWTSKLTMPHLKSRYENMEYTKRKLWSLGCSSGIIIYDNLSIFPFCAYDWWRGVNMSFLMKGSEMSFHFLTSYSVDDWIIIVKGYIGLFIGWSHICMLEFDSWRVICVKIEINEIFECCCLLWCVKLKLY